MIPAESLLAKVDGAMNAIAVHGDAVGPTLFYGAGAGELPTASAVVADLMELAREVRRGSAGRVAPLSTLPESLEPKPIVPLGELLRALLSALHRAWTAPACSRRSPACSAHHGISIESVIQKGRGHTVPAIPSGEPRLGADRGLHASGTGGGGAPRARRDRSTSAR